MFKKNLFIQHVQKKLSEYDYSNQKIKYSHTIKNSDLDHYGHMNNAKYLMILSDALRFTKDELIEEVQVDYLNQGYLDDVISVYSKKENNEYYIVGKNLDKVIFVIKTKIKA